ncbi:MAG: helix-turn-helix domain-containing protein [bacterium]|nr:helix-turn-helix domain-containing protein [bacterium]
MNYFERLQNSINFIESNLTDDITLAEVAEEANCSLYHFHRLFQVFVGNSLKEYIRMRRLTSAARQLVETNVSIIDIAYDYQYGSPESFSRAFKKMHGLTPWEYRKWGVFVPLNNKANLLSISLVEQKRGINMKPVIKEKEAFTVVGIELETEHGSCRNDVPTFWKNLSQGESLKKLTSVKEPSQVFGICSGNCKGRCSDEAPARDSEELEEGFTYLICSEVMNSEDIPEGFVTRTVEKGRYAVFTIKGGFSEIQQGTGDIFKNWLPNTGYELANRPPLEKYDERWTGKTDGEMEIWIPIK